jgi:hypothetical protein
MMRLPRSEANAGLVYLIQGADSVIKSAEVVFVV